MLKTTTLALAVLAVAASSAHAGDADEFLDRNNRMGCATITGVRSTTQQPLYDLEFQRYYAGRGSSTEVAQALSGVGVVGSTAALVGSLMLDTARDRSTALDPASVAPKDGVWPLVKAVDVQMDNGAVMKLPLQGQPKLSTKSDYEAGRRVVVYSVPKFNSVQLFLLPKDPPKAGERLYDNYCSARLPSEQVEAITQMMANMVDEQKLTSSRP